MSKMFFTGLLVLVFVAAPLSLVGAQTPGSTARLPANPESELGLYRFDLRIRQRIDSSEGIGTITYYVNATDNSLLLPASGLGAWWPGGAFRQGRLEFVIRQSDGDFMACGQHEELGPACLLLGESLGAAFGWLRDMTWHQAYFDSIAGTPQTLGEGPRGAGQGLRGHGNDTYVQMWFDPGTSTVTTRMPFLGLGVGVARDLRTGSLRTVRRLRAEGADLDGGDLVMDLLDLAPAQARQDTSLYRFVTAFTAQGVDEAVQIGHQGLSLQAEARGIQEALDACPNGQAGRECRTRERARMKALEDRFREQALDYGRRHGLPVDD